MNTVAWNVVAENMVVTQADTKREAREVVKSFHQIADAMGEARGVFTFEKVR